MLAEVGGLEVGRLSEGQKDCLRLVLAHMTSKEIARHLGISSHTVDQRLRYAIRILGARTRMQAALKLSEAEHLQFGPHATAKSDTRYASFERQDDTSPTDRLVHQSHDLSSRYETGSPSERRSAPDLTGLHRFVSASAALDEAFADEDQTREVPDRVRSTPAPQPRSAGELSMANWPREIHLRWYHKLLAILLIGILLIMAAGSLVVGIEALSHLLN